MYLAENPAMLYELEQLARGHAHLPTTVAANGVYENGVEDALEADEF